MSPSAPPEPADPKPVAPVAPVAPVTSVTPARRPSRGGDIARIVGLVVLNAAVLTLILFKAAWLLPKLFSVPWAFGLIVVSGAAGQIGAFLSFVLIVQITGAKTEEFWSREFVYTGLLTGIGERFFFTCVVGLLGPAGIAQAVVAWIAIKGQVHYKMFTEKQSTGAASENLPRAYVGLLGSLASLLFAILGGYLWNAGMNYAMVRSKIAEFFS